MSVEEVVYGAPDPALAPVDPRALQLSPFVPGAARIEDLAEGGCARAVILAPAGVLERRAVLAHAVRIVRPGGEIVALAPKARGGLRLASELAALGLCARDEARRHHRICRAARPPQLDDAATTAMAESIAAGALRRVPGLDLWSQPGVFSWDRLDPGSAALIASGLELSGRGADLGAGVGVLSQAALACAGIAELTVVELDRRALEAASRNICDPRARFLQADVRDSGQLPTGLDFVIMNPPFHERGETDLDLGRAFIAAAGACLRPGGTLRMVANVALPYEPVLDAAFKRARLVARVGGYKIHEAVK